MTDAGLKELAGLNQLQELDLYRTKVTDAGLKELAALTQLRTLDLSETAVTDAGLKELAALTQLRTLDLSETAVTGAGLKGLAGLTQLRTLNLWNTEVTDAGLKELAALTQLRTLDLRNTKMTDAGLKELAALTQLRTLNLSNTAVTDAGLKELAALTQLRTLDLWNTKVTDAGLKELAAFTQLQTLNLYNTKVTDAGLRELAALTQLQTLNLYNTKVTDAGLRELAALTQLQTLDLRWTKVTGAGLKELKGDFPATTTAATFADKRVVAQTVLADKKVGEFSVSGIGISLAYNGMHYVVNRIVPGGPVDKNGQIKINDWILGIEKDGRTISFDDMQYEEVIQQLRGPEGTKVRLVLQSGAAEGRTVHELARQKITTMLPFEDDPRLWLEKVEAQQQLIQRYTDRKKEPKVDLILLDVGIADAHQQSGVAFRHLKRYPEAIKELKSAQELLANLGAENLCTENPKKEHCDLILYLSSHVHSLLAMIHEDQGNADLTKARIGGSLGNFAGYGQLFHCLETDVGMVFRPRRVPGRRGPGPYRDGGRPQLAEETRFDLYNERD